MYEGVGGPDGNWRKALDKIKKHEKTTVHTECHSILSEKFWSNETRCVLLEREASRNFHFDAFSQIDPVE